MKQIRYALAAVFLVAAVALTAGCAKSEAETAPRFKPGTWASASGVNYVFYEDGESGRNVNVADGMGIAFAYEPDTDGNCVFHMGSVDDVTKATVVFAGGSEDRAAITWEDGSCIVLTFVSEDTSDEFADNYVLITDSAE